VERTAHNKGQKPSLETRIKQSKALGGKPFVALLNGTVQQQFETLGQASEHYGVRRERILEVLQGRRKSTRGMTFSYTKD
jgi:hypothetical protein